ncbi:MAG TPA: prolipoprotein diacylglyceryl transferase [Limnochordales bacterium]
MLARLALAVAAAAGVAGVAAGAAWAVGWLAAAWRGQRPVDPVAWRWGFLQVRWYGLLVAAAFVPGWYLAKPEMARARLHPDQVAHAALWTLPLAVAGARLGYVVQNLADFARSPLQALQVWEGGLSIHGALAGVAVAVGWYSRRFRVPAAVLADLAAPSVLLGQAIGRWGNFFNQELFGYPTRLPWGLYVPAPLRPAGMEQAAFFHPVFFYESVLDALGAALLVAWRRRRRRWGEVAAAYLVVYAAIRWLVEWVRIGQVFLAGMTLAQWVSLAQAAVGVGWWLRLRTAASAAPPAAPPAAP